MMQVPRDARTEVQTFEIVIFLFDECPAKGKLALTSSLVICCRAVELQSNVS